jgi:hypothetical protein
MASSTQPPPLRKSKHWGRKPLNRIKSESKSKVNKMNQTYEFEKHLMMLRVEEELCFKEGDWERLDRIRLAIDDTNDQIAKDKGKQHDTL